MKYLFVILMLSLVGCGDLEWLDVSAERMNYNEAIDYCEDRGARLPTIDELRTLIQNCHRTETGGECAITNSCASRAECWNDECSCGRPTTPGYYSVFGDTSGVWSSTTSADNTDYVWYVIFDWGSVGSTDKTYFVHRVRCVR